MKKLILKLAKEIGVDISIDVQKRGFDIYDYTLYKDGVEDTFTYYTGKTYTGIEYPFDKVDFLKRISDFIKLI